MVNEKGQNTTEHILMLGVLTLLGALILKAMVGSQRNPVTGAVNTMAGTTAQKIAADER